MNEAILIYDIETATDGRVNPLKDKLKVFGCYSYITNKRYYLTATSDIKKIISKHKYFVGFNNISYDNVVMQLNGFHDIINKNKHGDCRFKGKITIDLMRIIKNRSGIIKIKEGLLSDLLMRESLDFITKTLGLVDESSGKIKDFDYSILNKESWTSEDVLIIKTYLKRDLDVTKKLYDWLEEYFKGFKLLLTTDDVDKKIYLTCATSVFAYKVICKELGLKEEYNDEKGEHYSGGYVSYPAGEHFAGNIICMDYNSLYPHCFAQCNLYSPANEGWTGNGKFNVKGIYNDKAMGVIEKLFLKLYATRQALKKLNDPKEYVYKIVLNTSYGLSGNASFKHLYNPTTAADCTALARQWVMLARELMAKAGLEVLYTDTDSIYFRVNNNEDYIAIKDTIIKEIKDNVQFPQDSFDLGVDYEIKDIWFFKGNGDKKDTEFMDAMDIINKPKGFMKKNYIFLTKDNKVVVKNLGVRKKSVSILTRKIFSEYLIPKIIAERKVKYTKTYFKNLIYTLLADNLKLAQIRYNVKEPSFYKTASSLQAQIAQQYGPGIHFLIPNKKIGIGKSKKYCNEEEFKKYNLKVDDIDLSNVWNELGYFIASEQTVNLKRFFDEV